ncbi:DNA cytosine methyltransferase [Hymenobacter sp. DG01]|uniref:DNA cytosine methyltransferase n=1 Tax=Hymenobacter sp. DG01 TaxID=2584940 RepID=UPI00111FA740|nr:DNA cytosine methyltransferase [Hymenobacter sp. DG01]
MHAVYATLPLFGQARNRAAQALAAWMLFTATDLFCGAGGTTSGFEAARFNGQKVVSTTQVVNHDALAIASHKSNHAAARHFIEDITKLDASLLVKTALLWASLECTNFSNAKGGLSRDADSRSLAEHMERYIRAVNPLYFFVENVREFMSWGPLVQKLDKDGRPATRRVKVLEDVVRPDGQPKLRKNGKPVQRQVVNPQGELVWEEAPIMVPESRTKGRDFIRWKQSIEDLGYCCHYKLLNAADHGERTSRVRLFMIFAKTGLPVRWPQATHSRDGKTVGTQPWLPVRPCLNLEQKGESIFGRSKPLVEKTLKRIYAGLCKYIAGADVATVTRYLQAVAAGKTDLLRPEPKPAAGWLMKRTSNPPSGKANPGVSLDSSAPTLACGFQPDLVQPEFLTQYNGGSDECRNLSLQGPANTITTENRFGLVQPTFISKYYGNGSNVSGLLEPAGTITTKDRMGLVQTQWLDKRYGSGEHNHQSLDAPAGTITTNDHHAVLRAEAWMMPTSFDNTGRSLDEPCPTLLASRQHHYLVAPEPWLLDNKFDNVGRPLHEAGPTLLTGDHHYLITPEPLLTEPTHWQHQAADSPTLRLIRDFMRAYGLADVLMRMLMVEELLKIQGFPEGYVLLGSTTAQKKFIGNSVPPKMSQRIVESIYEAFSDADLLHLLADYEGSYATAA